MRRGSCLERLAKRSYLDTTRTPVWVSRHPRRPLRAPRLTKNALLLAMSPPEAHLFWCGDQEEDAEGPCHLPRLPPLSSKYNCFEKCRKTTSVYLPPASQMSRPATLSRWVSAGSRATRCACSNYSRSPRLLAPRGNSRRSGTRYLPIPSNKIKLFSQ